MKANKTLYSILFRQILFVCILFAITNTSCKIKQKEKKEAFVKPENKKPKNTDGKELSDKDKTDFEFLFFNANKDKILGNYDLAALQFSKALKINPNSGAALYELANIYSFQNKKDLALICSRKAAKLDQRNLWYQLLYIECLKEKKQFNEIAIVYEKLTGTYPDRIDYYYELANTYLYLGKNNDALKTYNKIEVFNGVTEISSLQKLKIYKASNNFEKSLDELKKLIKTFPKEAKYYGMLGELYQSKGLNEKALEAYSDLLKIDPQNAFVHLSLADYYRGTKQNDKAFEEIKIAFKSNELDIDTKVKILLSYYSITETYTELKADAEELCKIITEIHSEDAKSFSIYGDFLFRDKKYEEAKIQYKKAINLDKEKFALWNQLLIIESELNDFVSMREESERAIELFPNQPLPYFLNATANIQQKKYKDALNTLEEGKKLIFDNKPLLSQFYASIGDVQNQLKNQPASDSAYSVALEADPTNVYVLNNFSYYLSLRNVDLEKAEKMSKKCNELTPNNNSFEDTYGWILYQMKKYNDAKIWIGKALKNGGEKSGTILEHYGDVCFQLGETESALNYWMRAQKIGGASDQIDKKIIGKKVYE